MRNVASRATDRNRADDDVNRQPLHPEWNLGGYVNNAVPRIPVEVTQA